MYFLIIVRQYSAIFYAWCGIIVCFLYHHFKHDRCNWSYHLIDILHCIQYNTGTLYGWTYTTYIAEHVSVTSSIFFILYPDSNLGDIPNFHRMVAAPRRMDTHLMFLHRSDLWFYTRSWVIANGAITNWIDSTGELYSKFKAIEIRFASLSCINRLNKPGTEPYSVA